MRVWLAVALTLICTAVFGHGSEQWISDAKLVDPVSKLFCCGPTDCRWDRALPFSPDASSGPETLRHLFLGSHTVVPEP